MSEYRTPEEDTIGGHQDVEDEGDEPDSADSDEERVEPASQPD